MQTPQLASRIPHRADAYFTGRDEFIADLPNLLASQTAAGKIHVLQGPDGIGKTRIAVEYAYRYAMKYEFIGWLQAQKPMNLAIEFASIAADLNLPEKDDIDLKRVIKAVQRWLEQHSNWLLIFDAADSLTKIRRYLPSRFSGHVLVTSRDSAQDTTTLPLPVLRLTQKESIDLLLHESKNTHDQQTVALVEALDNMPLALRLAGSYLRETAGPCSDYLDRLRELRQSPLTKIKLNNPDNSLLLAASALSIQEVQKLSPASADLLGLCAFFASNNIPLNTIRGAMPHLPDSLAEEAATLSQFDDAVSNLERLSLVEVINDSLSIHEIIQTAVRNQLEDYDKKTYAEIAVLVMKDAIKVDNNNIRASSAILKLLPHVLIAAKHGYRLKVAGEATTSLLNQTGLYLESRGQLREAELVNKQALKLGESTFGPHHPALAAIYKSLGDILRKLGDPAKARAHYEKALAITEAAYTSDNPVVATISSSIGEVLHATGHVAEAREYFQRALSIDEAAYGHEHATLAVRLSKIGKILEELGEQVEAITVYERLIQILESTYGVDYDEAIEAHTSLNKLLEDRERLATNKARYEKGMEVTQRFLTQAGATIHQESERLFKIDRLRGRLKSFAPLPVLVTTATPIRQDVLELFQFSQRLAQNHMKRAGVLIYHEHPDVFVQMQIAELRVRDGFVIVPIPLAAVEQALLDGTTCAGVLAHYSQHYLPGVDLFDDRNAIGDTLSFFGRSELLHLIEGDLVQLQAIGLFGLRKSGKTSVLLQLGLALRRHPVVHIDLQPYGGKPRYGSELFYEIVRRLSLLLGDRIPYPRGLAERFANNLPAVEVSADFVHTVTLLAKELEETSYESPILIFLDEVERLLPTPNDPPNKAEEFNAFFGALRALSQQQRKIGLLVADVHPDCNRMNYWEQQGLPTNPVNQFFKELFLKPFSEQETATMIVNIGRLMGRSFDEETLKAIHQQSGGHPFVARQLASLLTSKLTEKRGSTIKWSAAHQYLARPFTYSGVLKDYFEQNIWGDMKNRSFHSGMAILRSLASNEGVHEYVGEQDLFRSLEDYKTGQLVDSVLWLESVGLLGSMEETSGERLYRIELPLLSQFIRMEMTQKEIRQWQI